MENREEEPAPRDRVFDELSDESLRLLSELSKLGIYGATPEIVAARFIDQCLHTFVVKDDGTSSAPGWYYYDTRGTLKHTTDPSDLVDALDAARGLLAQQREALHMSSKGNGADSDDWDGRVKQAISESTRSGKTAVIEAEDKESFDFLLEALYSHADDWDCRSLCSPVSVMGWGVPVVRRDDDNDFEWSVLISLQGG